jgi:competence protein ComEC
MKRPLGWVASLFGCGLLLGEVWQPPLVLLFSGSFGIAACAALFPRHRPGLLCAAILLAGWTNLVCHTAVLSPRDVRRLQADTTELVSVRGRLEGTPTRRAYARGERELWRSLAEVRVSAARNQSGWQPADGRIVVTTGGILPGEFLAGQRVEITGVLAPPPGPPADGLFDYAAFLRRQGVYFRLSVESSNDWRRLDPGPAAVPLNDRFRSWARAALAEGLPAEDESLHLEWALSLGDKTLLTEPVSEPFIRAATYHIFAVDGLRMAILFGILFALFRVLRLPRPVCGVVLIPLIWLYAELTGWPASAVRAAVMLTILIVGWTLKRPSDLINSLCAAALILLVWDPQQLFEAGFQLSFLVVLSLVVVLPGCQAAFRRLFGPSPLVPEQPAARWRQILRPPARHLLDLALTSFAAWIGSVPLAAYYFHILTPVSTLANIAAVPLCALVLVSNFTGLLLAGWIPGVAELLNHAGWFLMECIRVASRWFAGLPGAYCYVETPDAFAIAVYYAVLFAVFSGWIFKTPRRGWKIAGLAALLSIALWRHHHEHSAPRLSLLPLNGGSAAFYLSPRRADNLLIDCGSTASVDSILKPFLRAHGVNRLPCLILTHGDASRIEGAEELESLFSVDRIATSAARFRSPAYRRILQDLESDPDRRRVLAPGDRIGDWTVLHPDAGGRVRQADDNALVLFGNIRGTRLLLLSDLSQAGQHALLERHADLRADIVAGGLPGNSEPMIDALLDAVQPRLLIVTDSEFPAPRRAPASLRERLGRRGIPVVYTRDTGGITIVLRKDGWELRAARPQPNGIHRENAETRRHEVEPQMNADERR